MNSYDKLLKEYLIKKKKEEAKIKKKILKAYTRVYKEYKAKYNTDNVVIDNQKKWLENRYKELTKELSTNVEKSVENTIEGFTNTQLSFFSEIYPPLSKEFSDLYARVNEKVLNQIIDGNMYKDKISLSKRLWTNNKKTLNTINEIIQDGMIQKKNSKLIAKDLEVFVNPKYLKEYEIFTIHPKSKNKVEYNSYRLANTYINHAYQTASKESARKNPYVEKIKWISGTDSRVCDLCKERDGRVFDKDKVPLDHPLLGRCTLGYQFDKSLEEIAQELKDWNNGASNSKLDSWFKEYGVDFI